MTAWIALYLGYLLNLYSRAAVVAASPKNAIQTKWQFFKRNRLPILIRGIGVGALYVALRRGSSILGAFVPSFPVIPDAVFHPVLVCALGFGLDVLIERWLEKYPSLKSQIPEIQE